MALFFHLLYTLQHAKETCYAEYVQSGTPYVVYGGNCMQAWVITLFNHALIFVMP